MNGLESELSNKSGDLLRHVRAANQGDQTALAVLRTELSGGQADALIESVGNLGKQVQMAAFQRLGDQDGVRAVVEAKLERMRDELGWHSSNAVERLLIDRVAQMWLNLHLLELHYAQAPSRPLKLDKHEGERIGRAEGRYLRAIRALAAVRKLGLPLHISVNLGA